MNEQPAVNHAEFMVAIANLANTMEANAAATLQVMQRLGQPAGNGNGNGDNTGGVLMTLATFLKAMERALWAQHVPNNQYVEFAAYQLAGEAQPWWQKYFPESAREAKEMELMQLKQGSMLVADYTNKFEELCRFSRECQGAPESYKSWKCIKYQRWLKNNIMTVVAPLEIRTFSDLVNKARVVEEYAKTWAASKETHGGNTSKGRGKYFHPRGQSFKRGGYAPQGQGCFRKNNQN
ncbi:uncharacterized protein LOC107488729 [Arachis duranensis]|uniref:Uncharacterized protein LOC107488729 n=1 Tax=Arachis duranensis TaxID=130453 RepID=A0A6P4DES3_ARADU|nr:uncharacterized protein LOC107488729 [Arachis duranensis]